MSTAKTNLTKPQGNGRMTFSKIAPAMELPNLISVQKESFEHFMGEGLAESFAEFSPIENSAKNMQVVFGDHQFGDPAHTIAECRAKDISYQAPLFVDVRFINKETGEIKEQLVFMGDFPLMTGRGTFFITGTERAVVSQLVRSPGVYFSQEMDNGVEVQRCQFIPDLIIRRPHHIRRTADPVFYFQMWVQKISFLCIMDCNFPQLSKQLR